MRPRICLTLILAEREPPSHADQHSRNRIFDVLFLVHYVSQFMPLKSGDLTTGSLGGWVWDGSRQHGSRKAISPALHQRLRSAVSARAAHRDGSIRCALLRSRFIGEYDLSAETSRSPRRACGYHGPMTSVPPNCLTVIVREVVRSAGAEWLRVDGGEVKQGRALYSLESDKSVREIEAPASGTLRILAPPGQTYRVGGPDCGCRGDRSERFCRRCRCD
jgi:hypothetical protein